MELDVKLIGSTKHSDSDIARTAQNVLEWTAHLPQTGIQVMVEKGWITLSGEVEWGYQRNSAVAAIRSLLGVTGVDNNITLKQRATSSAVKSQIEASLKRRAIDEAKNITVVVHGNEVTLSGTVNSWAEHSLATNSAWGTPGVSTVVDNLTMTQ